MLMSPGGAKCILISCFVGVGKFASIVMDFVIPIIVLDDNRLPLPVCHSLSHN